MDEQNKPIIHLFSEGGYIALNSTEITNFGIEEIEFLKLKKPELFLTLILLC